MNSYLFWNLNINGRSGKEAKDYWTDFRIITVFPCSTYMIPQYIYLEWLNWGFFLCHFGIFHFIKFFHFCIFSLTLFLFARNWIYSCIGFFSVWLWILFCLTCLSCYGFPHHRVRDFRLKWALGRTWYLLTIHNLAGDKTRIFISRWISWQYSRIFSLKDKHYQISKHEENISVFCGVIVVLISLIE